MKKIILTTLLSGFFVLAGLAQQTPGISSIQGKTAFCTTVAVQAQTYSVTGTGLILGYVWKVTPSVGVIISSPGSSVTNITFPISSVPYVVTCYAFNSVASSQTVSTVVSVFETPKVTFSGNYYMCQGSPTNIQGSPTTISASSTISYTWSPATGIFSPYSYSTIANPSITTSYTVTYAIGTCTNSSIFTLNVMNCIVGIQAVRPGDTELIVYPNPSREQFNIRAGPEIREALLYDVQGKQVMVISLNENHEAVVTGLKPGMYIIIAGNRRQKLIISD